MSTAQSSDLVPTAELDLVPIVISGGGTLDLTDPASFRTGQLAALQARGNFDPLMLVVKANGDFYDGETLPDSSQNVKRETLAWHEISVRTRSRWVFLPDSGTVTIRGKLLLGN